MDRAVARHCKYGIIRSTFFAGRQRHKYGGRPFRTEWGGQTVGFRAYRRAHVIVAHVRGNGSLGKIFRVYRVAPRVVGADAGDGEFAGFTADLCGLHAVRNRKSGIRHSFVNAGHDLFPDGLMEGRSAVLFGQLLVAVTAAPDSGGIVRSISDEPDIIVGSSRSALAGIGHAGNIGR